MSGLHVSLAARCRTRSTTDKAVLLVLAELCDHRGYVDIRQRDLAALVCCDASTISRALQSLEDSQLVLRSPNGNPEGGRRSDTIALDAVEMRTRAVGGAFA